MIYNNSHLIDAFEEYLQFQIQHTESPPTLFIVQMGEDFASSKYVQYKLKKCEELGILCELVQIPSEVDYETAKNYMDSIPVEHSGIIVQLPLPKHFSNLIQHIPYLCDIDLLTDHKYLLERDGLLPPTIQAIDLVLKDMLGYELRFPEIINQDLDLSQKVVAVVGQGELVGKPLISYLSARNATIVSINKDTLNPIALTNHADIVISAAGVANLVDETWVKPNAIVIDAATLESDGQLVGDVNDLQLPETVFLCPSPGGIGKITILSLLYNLISLTKKV
jgi:methylenetetrahydrofolate dehydrogenase (NADP+) / methenyltetrahydrofolate cyclohydrolase